jgi:hypothetical protein
MATGRREYITVRRGLSLSSENVMLTVP